MLAHVGALPVEEIAAWLFPGGASLVGGAMMSVRGRRAPDLADRLRELLAAEPDVTEKRMFGGVAFLLGGRIAVTASGQGGLLVRVDPPQTDALAARPHAAIAVMRGREMTGWIRVADEGVRTKRQLEPWVRRGVAAARG